MILLLDTSTPICKLTLVDGDWRADDEWQAGRQLAKGLLGYLKQQLADHGKNWRDITGIVVMQGPGSFTGLRIGMTVVNTIVDTLEIPIVAERDDNWQTDGLARLSRGENDSIAVPYYQQSAHITKPRK